MLRLPWIVFGSNKIIEKIKDKEEEEESCSVKFKFKSSKE